MFDLCSAGALHLLCEFATPDHALQRTEAGHGLFLASHVLLRQPLSLSLDPLGPIMDGHSIRIVAKGEEIVYSEGGRQFCFEIFLGGRPRKNNAGLAFARVPEAD